MRTAVITETLANRDIIHLFLLRFLIGDQPIYTIITILFRFNIFGENISFVNVK